MLALTGFTLGVLAVLGLTLLLIRLLEGRRERPPHERLDEQFIYRKEPFADQLTEQPNRLRDNPVTKG